ncbi:endonuclease/exonuclease/phosphatase family protein [Xenorhabdus bovienii]|uniref:endonuclease/exonuclease/phosphatase family protein n=1 Tax=Xenorhabdus bovienii TaxID=40576 RepID=UPI003DA28D9C
MENKMINICFWNCGITPLKNSKATSEKITVACDVIIDLLTNETHKSDILIICEVNKISIQEIINHLNSSGKIDRALHFESCILKASTRSSFDMCIIYSKEILEIKSIKQIKYNTHYPTEDEKEFKDGTTIKAGILIDIQEINKVNSNGFCIIASHWPSDYNSEGKQKRIEAANKIRNVFQQEIQAGNQIVLIGDYNSHPWSTEIKDTLGVKFNKSSARKSSIHLYNASWNLMKPHEYHSKSNDKARTSHGTFVWKGGHSKENGSAILDQIFVSSAFISTGPWHLNESSVRYIYSDITSCYIDYNNQKIDHLPIFLTIER